MGGGPRTFPGGLSKWQYKRMHEKLARQKQRGLLRHEKQLYLARLRSEIRSSHLLPGAAASPAAAAAAVRPMSSRDHIRALADRFSKAGAEDLWNDDDGPLRSPRPQRLAGHGASGKELPLAQLETRRRLMGGGNGGKEPHLAQLESRRRPVWNGHGGKERPLAQLESRRRVLGDGNGRKEPPLGVFNPRREYSVASHWLHWRSDAALLPLAARRLVGDGNGRKETPSGWFDTKREYSVMPHSLNWDLGTGLLPLAVRGLIGDGHGRKEPALAVLNPKRLCSVAAGRVGRKGRRWRPDSSDEDEDEDEESGLESGDTAVAKRDLRFGRFGALSEGESEEEELGEKGGLRKKWSSAALRNCDMKKERRVLKSFAEENNDRAGRIQEIREEIRNREVLGTERRRYESREESLLTKKRFDECGISALTVKALADAGYTQTTVVQEAALPVCLEGKDVLVKAKTGTGKSAAFLLPAIESVLNAMKSNTNQRVSPIFALVLCPTRELAIQLAAEANVLLKYHEGIGVQSLVGGTRFKLDQKRLESNPCQILVATPGRLLDHIENKSGFSVRLMGLKMLVLDEADHLLDLGFRKDIEKIVDCLPRQRQTLLFSATIPKEVRRVSQLALKRDHVFVDTVGLGGIETPTKVQQLCLVVPHELHFHMVYRLLQEHIEQEVDYKVTVFCTTAMVTEFMYVMLRDLKLNVREIHSRKPQLYRTRISEEFRDSNRLILVTSDVSARGMNYPDVTLVIQVGIPPDREHYIHRLGRTGREGKYGKGVMLLAPWEEYFLNEIRDLPLEKSQAPDIDSEMKRKVDDSINTVDISIKEAAYHAWLGYYNSIGDIGRDKTMLADLANRFCCSIGLEKPPALYRKTALKMGFKNIPGIRIRK